ncbi:hypothetical protein [Streptomyces sp. NPDC002825]
MTVKVMIASGVMAGLVDVHCLDPDLCILPGLIELDATVWPRNS